MTGSTKQSRPWVYFVSTLLLRRQGAGPTVLVSPLLALMRDQIAAAERAGVRAVAINSTNAHEWGDVLAQLDRDEVDALLVSPERLSNPASRERKNLSEIPTGSIRTRQDQRTAIGAESLTRLRYLAWR